MAIKRSSSAKENINKKTKLDSEVTDYTKLLTSEDAITVESGDEQEFDDVEKPEKIKSAKKVQSTKNKNKTLKNDVENKPSKKTKGKPNTSNGIF